MINLDTQILNSPLKHPWKNGLAVGRAYDLVRADQLEHLRWLQQEVGFRSCRFHAVFHDDMGVVRRLADGTLEYQWHHVDKIYDSLLAIGLKPFVELNSMPSALASGTQTMFHYKMNVTPPNDWTEWHDLVKAFATHCVERYGLEEVRSWNFEVWNEPNLSAFWSGTKEAYFQLYAQAARAIKSVDSSLRVGGPATSKAYWVEDLIEFCSNAGVPLDFISTHLYPQDEFVEYKDRASSPHATGEFFSDIVKATKLSITRSKAPGLPIHWTEWNTQLATSSADVTWGQNSYVDSIHGASFVVRKMVELDNAADSFIFWVASDIFEEGPIPNTPFSHTYGMLTIHGIPKATANAFRFLRRLRGHRIGFYADTAFPPYCGGIATCEGNTYHVLLWNDLPPGINESNIWTDNIRLSLNIHASKNLSWTATMSQIRKGAGSPYEYWESMGSPVNLSKCQLSMLRAHSEPETTVKRLQGSSNLLELPICLHANEVLHVEFHPSEPIAKIKQHKLATEEELVLEAQLGEKSRT